MLDDNKKPIYSNYKRQSKLLGIIEYKTAIIFLIYCIIVFYILSYLSLSTDIKIYIFAVFIIPIVFIFFININNESVLDIITNITLFIIKSKLYIHLSDINVLKKGITLPYTKYLISSNNTNDKFM